MTPKSDTSPPAIASTFFASPAEFRAWLARHASSASELSVGYYKVGTGKPSMTWAQSVDEALCYGWIDGVRNRVDDESYRIRFTPRKSTSIWSAVNIKRVGELEAEGRMTDAGRAAFEARRDDKSSIYSYEQRHSHAMPESLEQRFRKRAPAWKHWEEETPGYRKLALHWVLTAKQEATRERRAQQLIDACAVGARLPHFAPRKRGG